MIDAYIAATGIALPPAVPMEQFIEIDQEMRRQHGQSREIRETIASFVRNSHIKVRHSISPCWQYAENRDPTVEDIFTEYDFDAPAHLRAKFWHDQAPKLAIKAAQKALKHYKGDISDITHVITTSTTGWAEPGIAVSLIDALGLSEDTMKIEININGCFCGASCLRTARDIIRGGEAKSVLVVGVELASVQYNIVDTDVSSLVSSSLFSDGAGAVIVSTKGSWKFTKSGMSLVPGSRHLLKLNPNFDRPSTAYKMHLDPSVGNSLNEYFSTGRGKGLLDQILQETSAHPALAVHPGGPNILNALLGVYIKRGWDEACLEHSFKVLEGTGNLGSTAILFVLDRIFRETSQSEIASFAFGPGVTVEWGIFEKA